MPIELIAPSDIGKVVAMVFEDRTRFAGMAINIAGDMISGVDIGAALSRALGRAVTYRRFPDQLLTQVPDLAKTVHLFDSGKAAGHADIAALTEAFGPLESLDSWLAGPGNPMVKVAADASR